VDVDDSRSAYGAESSDYYLNLGSPYKAKNGAMDSIDELLMLKDMTPEIFYGMEKGSYEMASELVDNNKGDIDIDLSNLKKLVSGNSSEKTIEKEKTIKFNIAKERSKKLPDYLRVNGNRSDFTSELNKININTASYRVLSALTDTITDDNVKELISRRLENPFTKVDDVKDLINDDTVRKNILSVKSYIFKITAIGTINKTSVKITAVYYRDNNIFLYWSEQ
jgi:General secretion pathway protein K.